MIFEQTDLDGAYVISLEEMTDDRGFFARSFCQDEFAKHGLDTNVAQCNISYNKDRGTLRGMHYQQEPFAEAKLVRCTRGGIYDVIIDIRPDSKSYLKTFAVELSADNRKMLFVPKGFAHGFQTLTDHAEVFYQMSDTYQAGHDQGIRWNDPAFAINWPIADPILSERDAIYADWLK